MIDTSTPAEDADFFDKPTDFANSAIEAGTVGWASRDKHFEIDEETGITLVMVTLFKGHPSGKPTTSDNNANGQEVMCRIGMNGMFFIPTKGTQVIVAFPGGHLDAPASGIIIATPGKSPINRQFAESAALIDLSGYNVTIKGGAAARILFKLDGSVTLATTDTGDDDGAGVYLKIAKDKLQFISPWGTLTFDATGFHITTNTGGSFDLGALGAPGPLAALMPNYCQISAAHVMVDSGSIALGPSGGMFGSAVYSVLPPPAPSVPLIGVIGPLPACGSSGVFIGK